MPGADEAIDHSMVLVESQLDSRGVVRSRGEASEVHERYSRYLFARLRPFLRGRLCEIGSGTGRLTALLGGYERVTAVEPYGPYHLLSMRDLAFQLNITHARCTLEQCPNDRVPAGAYDTVLCLGLLEHLEYDITALEIMGDLTAAGGNVIVVVPAGRFLFNRLDQASGHLRRYSEALLRSAFQEAGLMVTRSGYFDIIGLLSWWLFGGVLRRNRLPWRTRAWTPLLDALERRIHLPIGQSLLMIGRRPGPRS